MSDPPEPYRAVAGPSTGAAQTEPQNAVADRASDVKAPHQEGSYLDQVGPAERRFLGETVPRQQAHLVSLEQRLALLDTSQAAHVAMIQQIVGEAYQHTDASAASLRTAFDADVRLEQAIHDRRWARRRLPFRRTPTERSLTSALRSTRNTRNAWAMAVMTSNHEALHDHFHPGTLPALRMTDPNATHYQNRNIIPPSHLRPSDHAQQLRAAVEATWARRALNADRVEGITAEAPPPAYSQSDPAGNPPGYLTPVQAERASASNYIASREPSPSEQPAQSLWARLLAEGRMDPSRQRPDTVGATRMLQSPRSPGPRSR